MIVLTTKSCVAYDVKSTGLDSEARSIVLPPEIVNSVPSKVICCASTFAYSDKSTELPFDIEIKLFSNVNNCASVLSAPSISFISVNSDISAGIVGVPVNSSHVVIRSNKFNVSSKSFTSVATVGLSVRSSYDPLNGSGIMGLFVKSL